MLLAEILKAFAAEGTWRTQRNGFWGHPPVRHISFFEQTLADHCRIA